MDRSEVDSTLAAYGQDHLLRHKSSLGDDQLAELYAEIAELDLNKVAKCWDEAQKKLTETSEKKDDQLEPLDRSIVGSTTRDKANVPRWEALGKYLHHWITLRARADKPCVSLCAVQGWTR